ncbi:hypothetical protein ACFX1T_015464 [Malus domestica]
MMDGLCHTSLEHNRLQAAFKEVLDIQSQDIIELVLPLVQKLITVHPPEESLTLNNPTRVLLIKGQKLIGIVSDTALRC